MYLLKQFKSNLAETQKNFEMLSRNKHFLNKFQDCINLLLKTIKKNKKIIFIGNGGSAADAQHLSSELVGRFLKNRKPLPALALTTDTSIITSIGNDFNYRYIFSRQIDAIATKDDVIFAITTSGNSKNILEGLKTAKKKKCKTVCLTKVNHSKKIIEISDIILAVSASRVDRIQEQHIFIGHNICEILEKKIL